LSNVSSRSNAFTYSASFSGYDVDTIVVTILYDPDGWNQLCGYKLYDTFNPSITSYKISRDSIPFDSSLTIVKGGIYVDKLTLWNGTDVVAEVFSKDVLGR